MVKAPQLGGGSDYARKLRAYIDEAIGSDNKKASDREFADYLRKLKPQWEEIYPSLETAGKNWTQIAFSSTNAVAWRAKPVGKDAYALKGKFKILPGGREQLNLLLARSDDGFISIAFSAGYGVTVFEYHADHAEDKQWERLGKARCVALKLNRWIRFRVEVEEDELRITLGKKLVLTKRLRGRPMRGPWGLGAQAGSAGMWRGVKLCAPLPQKDD